MGAIKSKSNVPVTFQVYQDHKIYIEELYRLSPQQSWKYQVIPANFDNIYYMLSNKDERATLELIIDPKHVYVIIEYKYKDVSEMIIWHPVFHTYETLTATCHNILSFFSSKPQGDTM